ncbi:hypothetical protein N0V86_006258 [Didymella sp. IMI 355093]|nr:hypothetical protein N0V86_006258 [Didymella sp. IMI 355093]
MAEALGVVASIVQVAGAGLQLSKTLYLYADGVATADRRLRDIAKEIKLTSRVIEELGNLFKNDETAALISNNALKTANETMRECSTVFAEIENTLKKSKNNTFGRLMLPFRDAKIELLRSHIDKLKSTLQLLMQVLTHAYHVASQKLDRETEAKEREKIRQLLQRRNGCTEKYQRSIRSFYEDTIRTTDDTTQSATDNADVHLLHDPIVSVAAIGHSMTATALASCVQHVRSLLKDLETLQENLRASSNGDDQSQHYQNLTNSGYNLAIDHLKDLTPMPQARQPGMDLQPALNRAAAPMVISPKPSPLIYDRPNVDFTPFGDDIFADHQAASISKKNQRGDDLNDRSSVSVYDTQGVISPHTGQDVSDIRRNPRKALVQTEDSSFEPDKNASDSEPASDRLLDYTLPKDHIRCFVDEGWALGERNSVPTPPAVKSSPDRRSYNPSPQRIRPPITYGSISLGHFNASSSNVLNERSQYAASQSELVLGHRRRHYSDRIDIASNDSDVEAGADLASLRMAEGQERIEEARGRTGLLRSYSYAQVDEVDALLRKWTVILN